MFSRLHRPLLLIVLAVALLVPTLLPQHRYPQTVFYHEWGAALGAVVLFGLTALSREGLRWKLSGATGAIMLLMIGMLLNVVAGPFWSVALAQFWMAALLLAVAWAVAEIVRRHGSEVVVRAAATGILTCAVLQTIVSVAQLAGWDVAGLVMPKLLNSTYGNIAQPNHYGNLLWLGMASGMYLWLRGRLPGWLALVIAIDLSIFSALSASRAVLLYTVGLPVLALVFWRGAERATYMRVVQGAVVIFVLSCLAQTWVAFGGASQLLGVASSIGRLDDPGSNTQRLFDWAVAVNTALHHPFTGSGIGSFAWQTAVQSIGLPPAMFVRVGENAHDTPLHFAAELGLIGAALVLGCFVVWLWGRLREEATEERFWALGLLVVIGAHSLVEYPLWYAYFLLPLGAAIGVLDGPDDSLPTFEFSPVLAALPFAAGVALLVGTMQDYRALEEGYAIVNNDATVTPDEQVKIRALADGVSSYSMFATHAGILKLRAWQGADPGSAREMAALCDSAVRAKPSYSVLEKCVGAYALRMRRIDAVHTIDVICGAYPAPVRHNLPAIAQYYWQRNGWTPLNRPGCV